jgi:hypothetical protein
VIDPPDGSMPARDVTSLVTLFVSMLAQTKGEILHALTVNSDAASARWAAHEREVAGHLARLDNLEIAVAAHLAKEERADLVMDARVRPLRFIGGRLVAHWRDIVILVVALLTLVGIGTERV